MLDANRFKQATEGAPEPQEAQAPGMQFQFQDAMTPMNQGSAVPRRKTVGADDPGAPPAIFAQPDHRPHFDSQAVLDDEELWPGGPLESMIDSWKKQFGENKVFITQIDEEDPSTWFVWHPLQRLVYKQILSVPNTDPLQREEMICEACVLWPIGFDYTAQAGGDAGVPAVLAEQIMEKSGFTRAAQPKRL